MRRMLAGFLATSMIVAVASSVTFAATSPSFQVSPASVNVTPSISAWDGTTDIATVAVAPATSVAVDVEVEVRSATFELFNGSKSLGHIVVPIGESLEVASSISNPGSAASTVTGTSVQALSANDVRALLLGKRFSSVRLDDEKLYSGVIEAVPGSASDVRVKFQDATTLNFDDATMTLDIVANFDDSVLTPRDATPAPVRITHNVAVAASGATTSAFVKGTGTELSDVEKTGDFFKKLSISDVIVCDGDARPVPMTEKSGGVDKDLNGQSGVQSGTSLYFMINDNIDARFADDTYWKMKITKGDNGKMIKAISDVTKVFSGGMYDAYYGNKISNIDFSKRHRFIKVELNENYTDDEFKMTLDVRLSPTSKAENKYSSEGVDVSDAEIKVKDFYFYMKNIVKPADNDWKVGITGLMLNPLQNDWNEVTYFDEDGDLAFMKFFADSDVSKFYAKLSTKWEHADYASYFNDQDAFIFDFVGSPKISATSRCDLQIYNPFVDDDGNETIDPATATIYQVIDGDLFDVTDNFSYEEGDNGDMAFVTRTRFLGTYIICEKPVEEAVDGEAPDTDLVPEDTTPVEVTPGNDDGGKAPANTGKYL